MPHFSELSNRIRKLIERPLGMEKGYVLDFSNKTIEVFFNEEFGIDFYTYSNQRNGTSKAKIAQPKNGTERISRLKRVVP